MYDYRVKKENVEGKPVAVVLGGTVPHGDLIKLLKKRNFHTIVIDYFDNPPAAKYADVHCHESAMDYDVVLEVARENKAVLILSSCLDQQINIAMKAAEELGIAHPFSPEQALMVTDKKLMKKRMMESGIPTSRYYVVDKDTDITGIELTYPVIVKPADSCGSAGIVKLEDAVGLEKAVRESMQWSDSGKVIVEEFVTGTEMSVHGYVEAGKVHLLFGTCKITSIQEEKYQQLCNVYVPRLKESLQKELERIAGLIVDKFGIPVCTPLFMQVIVRGTKVSVIEFSPRVAGGMASYVASEYAGFDLLNYSIDSYLGEHRNHGTGRLEKFVCCHPLYCKDGILKEIKGVNDVLDQGIARRMFLLKELGDHIDTSKPSSSNVMKYVIEGDTALECYEKMQQANELTEIYDVDGRPMRDYSFILTKEQFEEKLKEII
ncbi:MAG: ATP-grasp domain-containing protein [Lachnospiraceae bacterium]|nr:ATP-grasp domain-containing protein [Lachnospiraceae bacterium]